MIRILATLLTLGLAPVAGANTLPEPAPGQSWWGIGATGMLCYQPPCPFNGIFPMDRDGNRGKPLSPDTDRDPKLAGSDIDLARIRAAFDAGDCLIAEGRLDGDRLVVSRIHGSCGAGGVP